MELTSAKRVSVLLITHLEYCKGVLKRGEFRFMCSAENSELENASVQQETEVSLESCSSVA